MDAFFDGLGSLCEAAGFKAAVVLINVDDHQAVSTWWPGCPPECDTVKDCTARVFAKAAISLADRAQDIAEGTQVTIDGRNSLKN